LFAFCFNYCAAQSKLRNDTIHFGKFKGVIADSLYTPFASRNIFPKNRFKPTPSQVKEFESSFIGQYENAIKKHHELFYQQYHNKSIEDEKWLTHYKDGEKDATQSTKRLKKEYSDYDRFYYGYIKPRFIEAFVILTLYVLHLYLQSTKKRSILNQVTN
jgi:hypothetical protein